MATVTALDADTGVNGKVWYAITNGNVNNAFSIINTTGDVITVGAIDREDISIYILTIKAEDHGYPAPRKVFSFVDVDLS